MNIQIFKSSEYTPFAPYWSFPYGEDFLTLDLNPLKEEILQKEQDIINSTEFVTDSGTGLGKHSLTSRSPYYNLLEFDHGSELKTEIAKFHKKFLDYFSMQMDDVYVQCWANVMRKGQKIQTHCHGTDPYTYLSGHISLDTYGTNTYYVHPYLPNPYVSENIKNKITLFPGWLKHYTDRWEGETERVTIAFDLYTEDGWRNNIKNDMKNHWLKL